MSADSAGQYAHTQPRRVVRGRRKQQQNRLRLNKWRQLLCHRINRAIKWVFVTLHNTIDQLPVVVYHKLVNAELGWRSISPVVQCNGLTAQTERETIDAPQYYYFYRSKWFFEFVEKTIFVSAAGNQCGTLCWGTMDSEHYLCAKLFIYCEWRHLPMGFRIKSDSLNSVHFAPVVCCVPCAVCRVLYWAVCVDSNNK